MQKAERHTHGAMVLPTSSPQYERDKVVDVLPILQAGTVRHKEGKELALNFRAGIEWE